MNIASIWQVLQDNNLEYTVLSPGSDYNLTARHVGLFLVVTSGWCNGAISWNFAQRAKTGIENATAIYSEIINSCKYDASQLLADGALWDVVSDLI